MAKENSPVRHILNPPPGDLPADSSAGHARAEFAKRLQHFMASKGLNQADLARETSKHLPKGVTMGRDSVSYYVRGKSFPTAARINALAKVLGVKPEELVPTRGIKTAGDASVDARDMADGRAWLRVDKAVPWPVAVEVLKLLQGASK